MTVNSYHLLGGKICGYINNVITALFSLHDAIKFINHYKL